MATRVNVQALVPAVVIGTAVGVGLGLLLGFGFDLRGGLAAAVTGAVVTGIVPLAYQRLTRSAAASRSSAEGG